MLARLLCLLALLLAGMAAHACPWCQRFGVKETVSAGAPDPGGKFFGEVPPADKTRHYYVAAEPTQWTWVPLGVNTSKPQPLPPDLVERPHSTKVRYVQYTDATFTRRLLDTPRLGIIGPILRGVVGEYLAVTFLNRGAQPLSMHSHCVDEEEINLGLAGFIVVTDPARARPDGTPSDVDREVAALFMNFDESPEDEAQDADLIDPRPPLRAELESLELRAASLRPSVNGRMFGNLPSRRANRDTGRFSPWQAWALNRRLG